MRCTMALITLLDAQLAFGHVALLDHASFSLEANERVGLANHEPQPTAERFVDLLFPHSRPVP